MSPERSTVMVAIVLPLLYIRSAMRPRLWRSTSSLIYLVEVLFAVGLVVAHSLPIPWTNPPEVSLEKILRPIEPQGGTGVRW